jgi:hypothetical protein
MEYRLPKPYLDRYYPPNSEVIDGFRENFSVVGIRMEGRMAKDVLRDKNGYQIGWIETDASGKQLLHDKDGYLRGSYNPHDNTTRDVNGSRIGSGNLLVTLL